MPRSSPVHAKKPVIGTGLWNADTTYTWGDSNFLRMWLRNSCQSGDSGDESGFEEKTAVIFKEPRTVDYRADVHDIGNT